MLAGVPLNLFRPFLALSHTARGAASCAAFPIAFPAAATWWAVVLACVCVIVAPCRDAHAQDQPTSETGLLELSLEELTRLEVISGSRTEERLWTSPAAIAVISREDIRRAGVTSIAEALRLVPGVQVARIDASKWSIGVRGFGSRLARSLLVQIDGRSVYTPLFAGTYWEVQDLLLEDIERIEVNRGPGGSLWGANAVNGVINIITRPASGTQGLFVETGGGLEERGLAGLRYGGTRGPDASFRLYAKAFDRDAVFRATGSRFDGWRMGQVGFRADRERAWGGTFTFQGDAYRSEAGQRTAITHITPPSVTMVEEDAKLSGGNVMGRWQRRSDSGGELALRSYYDRTDRRESSFRETRDTFDGDLQQSSVLGNHRFTWGLGARYSVGTTDAVPTIAFTPPRRADRLFSGFVRDDIGMFSNAVQLALDAKLERNDYSGFEVQPTARLAWVAMPNQTLWARASRAIRSPSRLEHDLTLTALLEPTTPTFVRLIGDHSFQSEEIVTSELGYRLRPAARLLLSTVAFHNRHRQLLSFEPGTPFTETDPPPGRTIIPYYYRNQLHGQSYGGELLADWLPTDRWRLRGWYALLRLDLETGGNPTLSTAASTMGSSPRHSALLWSQLNFGTGFELDIIGRYVDALPALRVPSNTELDLRLGWRPGADLELAVVGQSLLRPTHREYSGGGEAERTVYGKVTWRR